MKLKLIKEPANEYLDKKIKESTMKLSITNKDFGRALKIIKNQPTHKFDPKTKTWEVTTQKNDEIMIPTHSIKKAIESGLVVVCN